MTAPTTVDPNQDLWDHLQDIWDQGQAQRQARIDARRERPMLRLWDADWNLAGLVHGEIDASFTWRLNDTGTGVLRLPMDHRLAPWILDIWGRETEHIHITMDKDGARWGGRLRRGKLRKDSDGVRYIELQFLHDYENLKRILVWSNAFLPAALQFPRISIMAGPSAWVLKVMLLMNLRRVFDAAWRMPADPLDPAAWANRADIGKWETVVMPGRLADDSSPWTVATSRFKYWHDMAESTLADAELMVDCRRWLEGDPEPWPGANLRNGTLIVDIVDKSGRWSEDGHGTRGNLLTGILRTVTRVVGGIDDEQHLMTVPTSVPEYEVGGRLGTVPRRPYVTYRDGSVTGVEAAEFTWEPSQAVRMTGGGHSLAGVNETMSAAIQLAGNTLGQFVFVPTAGTIADTILRPLYTDTILAWMSMKSPVRAMRGGWSHWQEHFARGADRAYTIAGLVAMREAFWETRARTAHQLEIADGAPWFVGDRGVGHFFLGDRISSTVMGLPPTMLVVEQVSELSYSWSRDHMGWKGTLGDFRSSESPLSRAIREVSTLITDVHNLGVI